ncbi:MAG: radical SAM family heme chaperone HemW [Daejeonella sp.]|uniref:radical SAM family heme chaperone HemW n=1 Tax=Daejeonella sp. TaxID=2805397 RepID=UPI002736B591|nr:radical SAM family heme chaperone HemW [Daejeonella sp.]MDP3469289.1 radical SAM family heme chaperone HemW [Daejeonella sp.]
MAGIYIHIPFCKKACHYCDFHFSTSPQYKDQMLNALRSEIILRKNYLGKEKIETIYFGGGTPSLLSADELQTLLGQITDQFEVSSNAEITLEANPDDLNPQFVREIKYTLINRFSVGVQSFYEEDLRWMNRAHTASEALSAIKRVQDAGFENITADLIYGFPLLSNEKWEFNIQQLVENHVPHVSSYSITVEPKTALAAFIKKGKQSIMDEGQGASQFLMLIDYLSEAGFEHYEISNFAKPGMHSRHNSNYWDGVNYLGIGPSAHSFNGESRQWNISNNSKYINEIQLKNIPAETELLSTENKINEYIMTSMRTSKGMNLQSISEKFGSDYSNEIYNGLEPFIGKEWIKLNEQLVTLTREGKLFADHIASELFLSTH